MTPQERKVFELALEALENTTPTGFNMETDKRFYEAITAIKEALAQPKQEPVAWEQFYPDIGKPKFVAQPEQEPVAFVHGDDLDNLLDDRVAFIQRTKSGHRKTALYTSPQRKPLSDEEMKKIWYAMQNIMGWYSFQEIARAIEATHDIKE